MATKKTAKDTTQAAVSYPVLNMSGKEVGSIELDGTIFASKIVESIVFDAVMWQLSKRRQGTHSVLTKGNMKGGGQKPWKQKGTGRARAGTNRSPLWVGGGVAHGPKSNPFGYELRVTKRSRRQALASALTDKVSQKSLVILDSLAIPSGKTKDMEKVLNALGVNGKKVGLLVPNEMACAPKSGACRKVAQSPELKAARNLKNIELFPVSGLNVWDVLKANVLVGDRSQFIALQEELRARGAEDAQATSGK